MASFEQRLCRENEDFGRYRGLNTQHKQDVIYVSVESICRAFNIVMVLAAFILGHGVPVLVSNFAVKHYLEVGFLSLNWSVLFQSV